MGVDRRNAGGVCSTLRTRLAMNPETGTALKRGLVFSEELWADGATFEVTPLLRLPDADRERHELVLLASASATGTTVLGATGGEGSGGCRSRP